MEHIWPTEFANVKVDASPVPAVLVIADYGRGKSTAAAALPGKKLVFDVEGSWAMLRHLTEVDIVELRPEADEEYAGEENTKLRLFTAFYELIQAIEPDAYDVIVIDTISDLYHGSKGWVEKNPKMFGRGPKDYWGDKGTMMALWPDVREFWTQILNQLTNMCQTVVLLAHPQDIYQKEVNTGKQKARGVDLTDAVTLKIWLKSPMDADHEGNLPGSKKHANEYWAYVEKSRLSWLYTPEKGKGRKGMARSVPMIPRVLRPLETGETVFEMVMRYMEKPQPDYGELNKIGYDPTQPPETDNETKLRLADAQSTELKLALNAAKREMGNRLVNDGLYKSFDDIYIAIMQNNLDEMTQDITKLLSVEKLLREYALAAQECEEDEGDPNEPKF